MHNFSKIIQSTFSQIFSNWRYTLPLIAIYCGIFYLLNWGVDTLMDRMLSSSDLNIFLFYGLYAASWLLGVFLLAGVASQLHRFWLGETSSSKSWLPFSFSWKYAFGYFWRILLFVGAFALIDYVIVRVAASFYLGMGSPDQSASLMIISLVRTVSLGALLLWLPIYWVALRLSAILPAYASNSPIGIKGAWRETRSVSFAVFLIALCYVLIRLAFVWITTAQSQDELGGASGQMAFYFSGDLFSVSSFWIPAVTAVLASLIQAIYNQATNPAPKRAKAPKAEKKKQLSDSKRPPAPTIQQASKAQTPIGDTPPTLPQTGAPKTAQTEIASQEDTTAYAEQSSPEVTQSRPRTEQTAIVTPEATPETPAQTEPEPQPEPQAQPSRPMPSTGQTAIPNTQVQSENTKIFRKPLSHRTSMLNREKDAAPQARSQEVPPELANTPKPRLQTPIPPSDGGYTMIKRADTAQTRNDPNKSPEKEGEK